MEESVTVRTSYFALFYIVLFSVLGYFVYDGVRGSMAILALCLVYYLIFCLSIIPFGGCIIQAVVMHLVSHKLFDILNIYPSWLTTCIFWCYLICGIVITILVTAIVIANLDK